MSLVPENVILGSTYMFLYQNIHSLCLLLQTEKHGTLSCIDNVFTRTFFHGVSYSKLKSMVHCPALTVSVCQNIRSVCVLFQIEKHGTLSCIDIRQMLISMRSYRMGLIQTPDQLRFSYLAVIQGGRALLGQDANSNIKVGHWCGVCVYMHAYMHVCVSVCDVCIEYV